MGAIASRVGEVFSQLNLPVELACCINSYLMKETENSILTTALQTEYEIDDFLNNSAFQNVDHTTESTELTTDEQRVPASTVLVHDQQPAASTLILNAFDNLESKAYESPVFNKRGTKRKPQ